MMKTDFHLHSSFSGDSDTAPEVIAGTALQRGLSAICFTEHYDADYPYEDVCFELDTEAYQKRISELRSAYEGRMGLGFGVELGLQPHLGELYRSYTAQYPFDFVIGSTHLIDGKDPYYASFWEGCTPENGIRRFLEITLENMKAFDDFDVYGHLDYIVRYGPSQNKNYAINDYMEYIDPILRALIEKGKSLECNTGGFRYGLGHPNPCEEILCHYRKLGGELITVGSDAHSSDYVGYAFERTAELLKACGFRYYTVYHQRKPEFLPL